MSLLNEALRKNNSENSQEFISDFPSRNARRSERKTSIILIPVVVLIGGLIFVWMNLGNGSSEAGIINKPQTPINNDVATEAQVPEPALPEPVIAEKIGKEQKDNAVSPVREPVNKVSNEGPEKVDIPSVSKIPEALDQQESEEKAPDILKTKIADDGESYYRKAVQFHKQGRLEKAVLMYNKALSCNPEHFDALFNLASIYITMSRFSDAYNILIKLLSGNPADSRTALNLAITEIGLGKNRDALFHLQEIDGEDSELQFGIAFHKGIALSRLGKQVEAIACYKNAEMLNSGNPALLLNMAVLYDKLGNYNEAIDYYLRLINSGSSDSRENDKFKQRIETLQDNVSKFAVKNSS